MERLLTVAVALVLLLAACSAQHPSGRSDQWCVNRWNQLDMNRGQSFAIAAVVSARPACSVTLANMSVPSGGPCRRAPGFGLCIDRDDFQCNLNRYGAYTCPSHANHRAPRDLRHFNAAIRHGRLVLDRPPRTAPATPVPAWATRYPHPDGFIQPWTRAGRLRPGLTLLRRGYRGLCATGSELSTAPGALRCFTAAGEPALVLDPCFAERPHWRRGGVLAACPELEGSTTFARFAILGAA